MRRFVACVCLAAGLGIAIPALPAFAEVLVLPAAERGAAQALAGAPPAPSPAVVQSAALTHPPRESSRRSELLMLVAGLTIIGVVTLWRG